MLVPEAFEVLGGLVEELEAARQRLVEEVNKPPRGIRCANKGHSYSIPFNSAFALNFSFCHAESGTERFLL